jgi:hypothetical protein
MISLLKSRRAPAGPLAAELKVRERMAGANPVVLQVSLKVYPPPTEYKRGYLPLVDKYYSKYV